MRLYAAATVALFLLLGQAAGVELMEEQEAGNAESQSAASAEGTTTEEAEGVSEPPIKLVHVLNPGEREYLSPNLIGVQNIAMSFLPLSMNFVNIVDAFREITSGVRYEILLNAVDTKAENADTICRLVILEKPWLRTQWGDKHRELVNSNCTDSAENSLSSDPAEKARLLNEKYVSNSIFNGGQRNELSDSEMANLEAQILTGVGPMKRKVSLNKSGAAPPAAAPTSASPLAGDPAPAAPALLVTITVSDWKPTPPGPESGPTNEATTAISIDEAAAATEQTPPESVANDGVETQEEEQQQQQQQQQQEEQQEDEQTTPTAGELGPFGTQHAYPLTVSSLLSMASANQAAKACCVRDGITLQRREMLASADVTPSATPTSNFQPFTCKLCLIDVEDAAEAMSLQQCDCQFCIECMRAYVEFEISEGAYEISCPDAKCPAQGAISLPEIANLTTTNLLKKHHRYRLNREIELDKTRTWCPRAGCETICMVGGSAQGQTSAICQMDESPSTSQSYTPQLEGGGGATVGVASEGGPGAGAAALSLSVHCPSCKDEFCALCKKAYHPNISCEEFGRRLIADGQDDIGIPFDNELIKCCPMCAVPIEKDEGCAQMMCKRCKHVFCWYCLASLDDDFLLRHYDKGPCKNKLGHSRASVVWHRAQVIGIFAGFGILLLVASPLLLLAAPCIICCKCRGCSGSKIDEVDAELEEEVTALQG